MSRTIQIFDTTLRDGEQMPGVTFTLEQKLEIAQALDELRVDVIEAGTPVVSQAEFKAVKQIAQLGLSSKICALSRLEKSDMDSCLDCDVEMIHLFVPTSDVQIQHTIRKSWDQILELSVDCVNYVNQHGLQCMFSAMDATRTHPEKLIQIYSQVEQAGADIINVPDTVGIMVPFKMAELIKKLRDAIKIPISIHCHNDFGLATANSLAAVQAGADQIQVTLNGIGERAGNADLAECALGTKVLLGLDVNIRFEQLLDASKLVERYSGVRIPPNKPIVGLNAFSHESGIHVHGVIHAPETFEPGVITPEMIGHRRRILVGKHSGRHGIRTKLEGWGIKPSEHQLGEILAKLKHAADRGKQITDADLLAIAESVVGAIPKPQRILELEEISVVTGNKLTPTATVKAVLAGKPKLVTAAGVGPVDAAVNALKQLIGDIQITEFRIDAITGGSDALAGVVVRLEDSKGNSALARAAAPDIVLASVEAIVNAVNRLAWVGKLGK